MKNTDRIEKQVILRAPLERVWDAIVDSKKFGTWFGVDFEEPFSVGKVVHGRVVPTQVDAEIAESQKEYEGMRFDVSVERIEPMERFSFRWHPDPVEEGVAFSDAPTTLVVFELEDAPGGTKLTITESGFDGLPLERRARAFELNERGWEGQTRLIAKYLERHAA